MTDFRLTVYSKAGHDILRAEGWQDISSRQMDAILRGLDEAGLLLTQDRRDAITDVLSWTAEEYRRCIVSARATHDGAHYDKCNGRAEAYRQLANRIAEATGMPAPDWDAIREAVPSDGIYR